MMFRIFCLILILTMIGCPKPANQDSTAQYDLPPITYQGYFNQRFDYQVEYPEILIPQGEADNGDGQKFISIDGKHQMWVYAEHKLNSTLDDSPSFQEAYLQDMAKIDKIFETDVDIEAEFYFISWKANERMYQRYTVYRAPEFINIYFEFPESDIDFFKPIVEHVTASFNYAVD